jgi:hypothetical protein
MTGVLKNVMLFDTNLSAFLGKRDVCATLKNPSIVFT